MFDAGTRDKKLRSTNAFGSYDYDITADNWSLRARGSHDFGGAKNLLVFGTDSLRWSREVLGSFGSTASQDSRAWYVKDDVTLAGGTRIGLGWRTERADKHNTAGGSVDARENAWELGVSHPFGAITAYARVGRSFRFANVDEFSFTAPGAILAPQTSRDAELGVRWTHPAGKVEARLYRNDLTHEIGFDPNAAGTFGFGANVNFDPTRRQGLEVDATHRIASNLGLRVNANVREATFRSGANAGRDVPLVPKRTLAVRADWEPAPQLASEITREFYSERPISVIVTGSYHDMGAFASDVGQLPRIVTLNDVTITADDKKGASLLTMQATARTFRYLDDDELAAQRKSAKGAKK